MDPSLLLEAARKAARRGGEAAVKAIREGVGSSVVGRGEGGDYSLRGDVESEKMILDSLLEDLGTIRIVSEEMGERRHNGEAEFTAIIDPIDGSRNYKRGLPFFAVSVAIARGETLEDVVAAAIYAPLLNLEFTALKGKGAFLNGNLIHVTTHTTLKDGIVFVGSSPKAVFLPHTYTLNLVSRGAIVRSLGSASLELSFVASGGADAYIDYWGTMRVIDIAAAYLIAREAGAWVKTRGFKNEKVALSLRERLLILASSTPQVGAELHGLFKETFGFNPEEILLVKQP